MLLIVHDHVNSVAGPVSEGKLPDGTIYRLFFKPLSESLGEVKFTYSEVSVQHYVNRL